MFLKSSGGCSGQQVAFAESPKYLVMSFLVALLALPQNVKIQLLHNLHYVTVLVKGERRGTVGKFN